MALLPATTSGAYDSATTAKRTIVFILPVPAASDCLVGGSTESGPTGFGTLLSRSIHSTEKAAEVCCQSDDNYGCGLDRQAVSGPSFEPRTGDS